MATVKRKPRIAQPEEAPVSADELLKYYRDMLLIRRFEEVVNELYLQGHIPSTLHLYIGQEAVAVGVCAALRPDDYLLSTHRPHGHALAKGVSPGAILAELSAIHLEELKNSRALLTQLLERLD